MTIDTAGGASIASTGNGLLTVNNSKANSFTLTTAGSVALNDITTRNGDLLVTASTGTLSVLAGKHLEAKNGALSLVNSDVIAGNISIGANSIVETSGDGDKVTIAIGVVPKKPVAVTPPANVTIVEQGQGKVIFATPATGFVIGAAGIAVNAIEKNVILSNGSTQSGTQKITFGDNATVTADPPPAAGRVSPDAINFPSQETFGLTNASGNVGSPVITGSGAVIPSIADSTLNSQSITVIPTDLLSSFSKTAGEEITRVSNLSIGTLQSAGESTEGNNTYNYITEAYVWCDEELGLGSATMLNGEKLATSGTAAATTVSNGTDSDANVEVATLRKGTIVLAPSKDTRLDTPMGTVEVAKGSVALVVLDGTRLGVYDLHDARRGSVRVTSGSKATTLSPGRCTVLTNQVQNDFERINPMETIGYKSVASLNHGNGIKAFNAEFSTTHAMGSVKPLMEILTSKHAGARRMSSRLLKTSAVLMHIGGGSDDFKIFAEPSVTAMNR